jgi:predicted transposase/invertase (TIGR01784 family)
VKTDSLFHRIFRQAPAIFFELIGQPAIVGYQFQSIEVKQTAFRIDGVLVPPSSAPESGVYFIEIQFQKDNFLYHRLFAELSIYLKQHPETMDWHAVVIFPKRSLEPERTHLHRSLLSGSQVQRVYLEDLGTAARESVGLGLLQLIVEPNTTAAQQARELLVQVRQGSSQVDQELLIELIETTMVYKFPRMSRQEIAAMLGLVELQETRVYQEGVEEGQQKGRVEEARSLILKLLTRRVGTVPPDAESQIQSLSVEQLEALGEALLDFSTLADLETWLQQY